MICLLLDQGLPQRTAADLRMEGWDVQHVSERGLSRAPDLQILHIAAADGRVIVTLDGDFAKLVVTHGLTRPSVVHIRMDRVNREVATDLLKRLIPRLLTDLEAGCLASVSETGVRIRNLPV